MNKRASLSLVVAASVVAACGGGNDAPATLACTDLTTARLNIQNLQVASAVEVAASGALPAHCKVNGSLNARTGIDGKPYAIGFELRTPLPAAWNGKFFFQGGGGTNGVIVPATGNLLNAPTGTALERGYAVASTDGGHGTGQSDVSFGVDPQARSDYGYHAVGQVTVVAKKIVQARFGQLPARSYLLGCSNGGRDAMVASSRFADQFDGYVAGNPGFNLPKAAIAEQWDTQQFMSAAAPGQLPKDAFPASAMNLVAQKILAKCDALDGVADGMVNDRAACQAAFSIANDVPTCAGTPDASCLTAAQKTALQNIFGGARDSANHALYASWPLDPGVSGQNWRFWKLDAGFAPLPFNTLIGAGAMGYVFSSPPDAPSLADGGLGYQLGFSMDTAAAKIAATTATYKESALEFMTPPNPTQLTTLKARGKLIVVHGTADPVFSPNDTMAWYDALKAADASAPNYARLFLVPGMNHCSGGPATDRFDMLTALENWVEKGTAPDAVRATVNASDPDVVAAGWPATRSRPLCAYPKQAMLKAGATDTEDAASFECR
ncbi:tannase/feruloyl esterase family alpha/beta hydrolase [Piscinibacter terrae]|uniref:Tannase/feruloyl esterase family alpha/beta hydrolase n=1 Tax=Piscinibacter terrae TaxID=2496871 RepID=A0A3N7HT01_9BURK|nr:tannase/feruloyl esterase family alpha/beta hydrolase [Albitalea terrae]RQP24893.1 tannase/feruloyl esterase family alpha/beta hydrolase [Albitalea terrae]